MALLCFACDKGATRPAPMKTDVTGSTSDTVYGPATAQICGPEGTTRECGRVHHTDGDYVHCSVGHATCTNGVWGECVGDHFVIKSAPALRMTSAGLRFTGLGQTACTNACDPYCLQLEQLDPNSITGTGLTTADAGGVTLERREIQLTDLSTCVGLQCSLQICGGSDSTTISGRVYDPAGKNPLYNAEVYVPLHPADPLPAFGSGASCDTCGGAQALDAIRAVQTDANGDFTLSDVPVGDNIPVVVQMGKWRREIVLSKVEACTDNQVANNCTTANPADCVFRLPRNQTDGYDPVTGTYSKADLPQTAIISGSADPFDCLLLKAGIDPAEVGDASSNKRIHFYHSDSSAGNKLSPAYGAQVPGSTLWDNLDGPAPNLLSYDVLLLPCEGGAYDKQKTTGTNTPYKNLLQYVNSGGRAFATHYTYSWLAFVPQYVAAPDNWANVATWTQAKVAYSASKLAWTGTSVNTQDPMTGTVDTAFPKGAVFSQWLSNVHAATRPRRLRIHEGRQDLASIGTNAQSWMTAKDLQYVASPTYPTLFTFNTPYGADADKQCGRVVYSDFHVSAAARTQCTAGVCADSCLTDTDCGFTATCEGETAGTVGSCNEPCATGEDCPNDTYSCNGASSGKCEQATCASDSACGSGRTCQSFGCTCIDEKDCNGGTCGSKICDPGTTCHADSNCGKSGTCGRGDGAKAGSCKAGFICHNDAQCGPTGTCGRGTSSTKGTCARTAGFVCHKNADCDSGSCGSGSGATGGSCAYGSTTVCHKNADCDSNSCGSGTSSTKGTCAFGATTVCHKNADCDSNSCGAGTGATAGTCSTSAQLCHTNADCDSSSCGAGTGATAGACSTNAQLCHKNADCDSNSCGAGTGATAGTCSTNAQICHKNADCDSNFCGAGTGSALGVCAKGGGASCHKNADCDGNSCGLGTGAVKGTCAFGTGTSCHKSTDCDSNVCGSGTGAVVGKCSTSAQSCHKAADCDSGSCGSGTSGSSKGLCNGLGTCTSSAQCGGSATCVAGRCTSATVCSVDTGCGIGGICLGATCSNKTCGADATCTVGGVCNGATCSTPATCAGDAACPNSLTCNGATCSSFPACASDAACPVSNSCSGAKCGNVSCAGDSACTVSGLCNSAKCSTATCAGDSACTVSGLCNNAKCSTATCAGDSACSVGGLCNNAKCSTPATCAGDVACPASNLCTGSKCSGAASCAGDAACPVSGLCNNAKCSTATCAGDSTCPASGLCNNAKCSTSSCALDTDCPLLLCTGATCNASECDGPADCATGASCGGQCSPPPCTSNTDCESGLCVDGVCGCSTREDCGGSQMCAGGALGACGRSCTTDDECAPDRCVDGKCGGCSSAAECHDSSYAVSCDGIPVENSGTCSVASGSQFPESCKQGDLSPQEKALEFMFFDLTACVSPDNLPPPKPITNPNYAPATFVEDFTATCPSETQVAWREFDWQATVPDGTSIDLAAQSGSSLVELLPTEPVALAHAAASTDTGPDHASYDAALIDTGLFGTGAFNTADPQVVSQAYLRISVTLNPSADKFFAPRLGHWKVQYDCVIAQ